MSEQGYQPYPLRNVVASHVGGGTPSRQVPSYWRGQIPWASVKDFPEQSGVINDSEEHISTSGLNASAANLIPAGTPLVCTRMAVGRAAMPSVPMAINQDVKALFPAPDVSPAYLLKLLQFVQPKAEAQAVGSTVKGIRIQDYLDIKVPIADTDAQPVIARVLDTLDTAIHETEAIIAKLKAVKQGLLHDLLARGIDTNGELRPPQAEAPHLYKESPLGWIPKGWEVGSIAGACSEVIDCPHSTPHFQDEGVLVARTMHIKDGLFLESLASYVSEHQYRERITRLEPQPGDLVFTREAPVGEAFVVPLGMRICLGQRVMLLRPKEGKLEAAYLLAQIYSGSVKDRISTLTSGTTNPHLNVSEVKEFEIPLPPIVEQQIIASRLCELDSRLGFEMREQEKFELMKSGLMDDLLTGRVCVTPLLAEATQQQGSA